MNNTEFQELLLELFDLTPCAENDGLADLAAEADIAVTAAASYIRALDDVQARIVYAFRLLYLLGVQRGGEAYRKTTNATEAERPDMPFSLCKLYEDEIVDDLKNIGQDYLNEICRKFGFIFISNGGVSLV